MRCGGVKPAEEFTVDRSKPAGLGSYCRPCDRQLSREYYRANRERILAKLAAKRRPQPVRHCSECGVELEGRKRVTCGTSKCREQRFRRLHPAEYAERERRKTERRRETRRLARERADTSLAARPRVTVSPAVAERRI
jgi:hypothetical protein